MYKHLTKKDWLNAFGFDKNYHVDALIVDGGYKDRFSLFKVALTKLQIKYKEEYLSDDFLQKYIRSIILNNKYRIWFGNFYGSAALSEVVHWASLFGSNINLLRGDCGGLSKGLKPNDLVILTKVYGNESSTRMYAKETKNHIFNATDSIVKQIVETSKKHGIIPKIGKGVTCQAMIAETEEDIRAWQSQGYDCVEMEASTFYAVSNHFNVNVGALLIVADNLAEDYLVTDKEFVSNSLNRDKLGQVQYDILVDVMLKQIGML